jgi:polar amino acid transport system substrate-binding protein
VKKNILILFIILTTFAFSEKIEFYAGHIPPYSLEDSYSGIGLDVLEALKEINGNNSKVKFLPWKRAQLMTKKQENVAIIPLTRTKARENSYSWIVMLFQDDMVFAVKSNANHLNDIEILKNKRVGVLLGSFGENDLKELGFKNVQPSTTEDQNAKKLEKGRIDAWYVARMVAPYIYNKLEFNKDDLNYSKSYRSMKVFLGGSKEISNSAQKKWRDAMEEIKSNGTYDKILKKYK